MKGKFKAKPKRIPDWTYSYYDNMNWLDDILDEDGYVHGYYVDGFIVGDIMSATNDSLYLTHWIPVKVYTLEPLKEYEEGME